MPDAALMFSGGVDSTSAALLLAKHHDLVHLLSYGNGYGHYKIERTRHRARELQQQTGIPFRHTVTSVRELFDRFVVDDLDAEYQRWGSGFVWCLGCKLAMHTRSILYCLAHGVPLLADGSSDSTSEMVEQAPPALNRFRAFYADHGITFDNPVLGVPREESIRSLERQGFRMGIRVRDRFLRVQPKCRPGELYYMPFLLFGQPPAHEPDRVEGFLDEKISLAKTIIAERCAEGGWPLRVGGGEA